MFPRLLAAALLGLCAVLPAPAADDVPAGDAVDAALREAAQRRQPLLVEFRAAWCYSCYYMATHVHTGEAWQGLLGRAHLVDLDADSPEGAARMQAWNVKALPSYVLLDARGREIGRLLGEQRREDFYARIDALLARRSTLDDLGLLAAKGGKAGQAAAVEALSAFQARTDAGAGLRWFYDLPGHVRQPYELDAVLGQRLAGLRLMDAAQRLDGPACARLGAGLRAGPADCERPYELGRLISCTAEGRLPPAERRDLLAAQRAPLEALVEQRVFGAGPACADERSALFTLADLYDALGEGGRRQPLMLRAANHLADRIGVDLAADRNRADNLRAYLENAGDWDAFDALMPQLVAAWPDDYVYAFRFGRSLVQRDRASEALPYLERAASRAYGQNRLKVAEQQVRALKRLGRGEEATQLVAEVLEANGPWFADDAARLRTQL